MKRIAPLPDGLAPRVLCGVRCLSRARLSPKGDCGGGGVSPRYWEGSTFMTRKPLLGGKSKMNFSLLFSINNYYAFRAIMQLPSSR